MGTLRADARISLKRILFATDFSTASEAVLSHAVAIARRYRSKLYVAHMTPPELYMSVPDEILKEAAVKRTEDHAWHEMSRLIALGGLRKLRHRTLLEEGDIADTLLRLVREHAINLVVIGTRGHRRREKDAVRLSCREGFSGRHFLRADRAASRGERARVARILYPTNFSQHSLQAAPHAFSLARHYRAKLILLHVVEDTAVHSVADLKRRRGLVENRLTSSVLGKAELALKAELAVEFGDPAQRILRVAAEWQAGLIVLGVRRAKATTAHLTEGTAYKVVRQAPCPVLTVVVARGLSRVPQRVLRRNLLGMVSHQQTPGDTNRRPLVRSGPCQHSNQDVIHTSPRFVVSRTLNLAANILQ